ncbi:MAG: GAF domain-containing protein, partial [Acidimicrobiales bacterium]
MPTRHTTRPATGPILGLVAVNTGLAALLLAAAASRVAAPGALSMPWWLLAACFMVTEILVIHVQFRRGAHTFSLSEIPLVLGLFFAPPALILLARLLGAGLALVAHRRQALVKLLFNLSMFAVEVALASAVFHAVARHDDVVSPRAWAAAFCATLAATVYTTLAVSLAISISEGRLQPGVVGRVLATGVVLSALANTSLALVAVVALSANIAAGWLLAVVATIVFLAYSGYNSLRQRYHSLELLYDFTRVATGSVRVEALATAILSQARALLKAEQAEIVLADLGAGRDDGTLRMTLRDDDDRLHLTESVRLDPAGIRARVLGSGRPLLVPRHTSDEALATQLGREGLRDAMAAPLRGDGRIVGVMLVGSRLGDVRGFDREDLKLFETLANHTGVAIENGRLVQQLRAEVADKEHQALHDALTGLPNRTLFHERLRAALTAACAASTGVAVMLIDLDRFKEVNDT